MLSISHGSFSCFSFVYLLAISIDLGVGWARGDTKVFFVIAAIAQVVL